MKLKSNLTLRGVFFFDVFDLTVDDNQFKAELKASSFFDEALYGNILSDVWVQNNCLLVENSNMNDYIATFTAEFIRWSLLKGSKKFSFETVMSLPLN